MIFEPVETDSERRWQCSGREMTLQNNAQGKELGVEGMQGEVWTPLRAASLRFRVLESYTFQRTSKMFQKETQIHCIEW